MQVVSKHNQEVAAAGRVRRLVAGRYALLLQLALGGTLLGAAVAKGGYFPSSWGWIAVALLWLVALAPGRAVAAHRSSRVMVTAFGGFVFWTLAGTAWGTPTLAVRQAESVLVLLAGLLSVFAVVDRRSIPAAITTWVLVIAGVSIYSLVTRLFPSGQLSIDDVGGYRLTRPVGYWNALGIYAAIGLALAAGLAARVTGWRRVAGAAVAPILATTVYFTYSRGSALALAVGLIVTFALDSRRVQWLLTAGVVALLAAIAVGVASQSNALTTAGSSVSSAVSQGHRLAVVIVVMSLLACAFALLRPLPDFSRRTNRALTAAVTALLVAAVIGGLVAAGGPSGIKEKFTAPPPVIHGQLNRRLFSFSGSYRAPLWSEALHEYEHHPFLGGGSGSYEMYYLRHRTQAGKVRNAHNLYLETLAELGPIGLALLLAALATPLFIAVTARRRPFVPSLAGAYAAFVIHLGVDWDWQVTGIALMGLCSGAGVLIAGRGDDEPRHVRAFIRGGSVAALIGLLAVAFVVLVGNLTMSRAASAASDGKWAESARDAKRAQTWAPWSSEPYRLLGEAELGQGNIAAAVASFHKAIVKSPADWNLWFDLARATTGEPQRAALRRASALNPLSPEIRELRHEISADSTITVTAK